MSLVGKSVMYTWHNIIRYGVVKTEEMRGSWKYCTVDWVNDQLYANAIEHLNSLRGGEDYTRHNYRVDELLFIDVNKHLKSLRDVKKKLKK
tara:strand:- start:734 stop:1006 length:273 start_codon:yes stop_codon:yes gene_type:complete